MSKPIITIKWDEAEISDGYHTFTELYDHRIALYIALCRYVHKKYHGAWRSKVHSDGSVIEGWFILGLGSEKGRQITYHLPESRWSECDFAETLSQAPEWDGHAPKDVIERLKTL